jgi:hypothetical protein
MNLSIINLYSILITWLLIINHYREFFFPEGNSSKNGFLKGTHGSILKKNEIGENNV